MSGIAHPRFNLHTSLVILNKSYPSYKDYNMCFNFAAQYVDEMISNWPAAR